MQRVNIYMVDFQPGRIPRLEGPPLKLLDPLLQGGDLRVGNPLDLLVDLPVLAVVLGAVGAAGDEVDRVLRGALEGASRAEDGADGGVAPGVELAVGLDEALGVLDAPAAGPLVELLDRLVLLQAVAALGEEQRALGLPVVDVDEARHKAGAALGAAVLPPLEAVAGG